jgi:tetraacyldisaccharide 4'-kinase
LKEIVMHDYIYSLMTDKRGGVLASGIKFLLFILSILYLLGVVCLRLLYKFAIIKCARLVKPVISVGNVTMGGVGKTPLVIYISQLLQAQGRKPSVLLRGYMPKRKQTAQPELSDEAQLLQELLPDMQVGVGKNRIGTAKEILFDHDPDVFILDDGFQHWRVRRDLNIVAIDATNPFGNGHLLPRGILREPLYSLRRAHVFVLTKSDLGHENIKIIESKLNRINPRAAVFQAMHLPKYFQDVHGGQRYELSDMNKKVAVSLCAIGDPGSFQKNLRGLGVQLSRDFVFRDHHCYKREDIFHVVKEAERLGIDCIITTYKDAIKLRVFRGAIPENMKIVFLHVSLQIREREDEFIDRLFSVFGR